MMREEFRQRVRVGAVPVTDPELTAVEAVVHYRSLYPEYADEMLALQ